MAPLDHHAVLKFINETELGPNTHVAAFSAHNKAGVAGLAGIDSTKKQCFVNCGSIQVFPAYPAGPSNTSRYDSLIWTLFAQLAADKKYSRTNELGEWYQYYVYVLGQIGMTTNDFSFGEVTHLDTTVAATVCGLVKTVVGYANGALVYECSEALAKPANAGALKILNQQSAAGSENGGNFQVSAAEGNSSGNLTIDIGYYYYNENTTVTNTWFHVFTHNETKFHQGANNYSLAKVTADQTRATLIERLGDRIALNVLEIEI